MLPLYFYGVVEDLGHFDLVDFHAFEGTEMARADLIVKLAHAATTGNQDLVRRTVEAMAAEERAKRHHLLADRLIDQLSMNGHGRVAPGSPHAVQLPPMLIERRPRFEIDDLILASWIQEAIEALAEEHNRIELLRSYGVEPRHRVLLVGPPGNGKTSLAEAIADLLMVPLFVIRYDGLIGSYLGETAARLSEMFDFVRSHRCVLFFDEFDAVGKERGDAHETGEIKRVVNSLLLQVDDLPSHVIIVAASNHPEILDRAVWRRFQLCLTLDPPKEDEISQWIARFERRSELPLTLHQSILTQHLLGLSFSEISDFGSDILRRYVLQIPNARLASIVGTRIDQLIHERRASCNN